MQYERWSLIRLSPYRWYAVALPAALIAGLTGIGALTTAKGPDRAQIAIALAAIVALPYAFLMWLEARTASRRERAREVQLRMMRVEREWRAMSDWELSDRVSWILSSAGIHVDWVPTPIEAPSTPFAAVGRRVDGGRLLVHAAKGVLTQADMERVLGQAVLEGARELIFVAPAGCDEKARSAIRRGAPNLRLELWGLGELLAKSEMIAQSI